MRLHYRQQSSACHKVGRSRCPPKRLRLLAAVCRMRCGRPIFEPRCRMDTGPRFPWQIEDTEMYPRLQSTTTIINLTTKSNSNDDDDHAHTPAEALPAAWPRETKAAASLASRSSTFPRKPRRSRNLKLGRSVGRLSPEGALDKAEWLNVLGLELRHTGLNEGSTQPRSTVQSGCSAASDGLGLPNSPDCQRSNTQTLLSVILRVQDRSNQETSTCSAVNRYYGTNSGA